MGRTPLFSFPWPGPGNSEAPENSEGWLNAEGNEEAGVLDTAADSTLLATFPWPGPGDSEG